jgi:hypothetical protein
MALPTKIVQIDGHRLSAHWNDAILGQPNRGLFSFMATMASITSLDGPLGSGLLLAGIQQSILALLECVMKSQEHPGSYDYANSGYPPWIQEQRPENRRHSIQSRGIRRSAARSTVKEQLLLQQSVFGDKGPPATGSQKSGDDGEQVKQEDHCIFHNRKG